MVDPFRHDDGLQQLQMEVHDGALTTAFEMFVFHSLSFDHTLVFFLALLTVDAKSLTIPPFDALENVVAKSQTERRRLQNER